MTRQDRNSAIAAAAILLICGGGYLIMPRIMLALGDVSPIVATILALAFLLLPFGILWFRGRHQRRKQDKA